MPVVHRFTDAVRQIDDLTQFDDICTDALLINGFECGRGKGYSKKESHQKASRNALHRIKNDRRLRDELTKPSTDNSQQ